MSDNDDFYYSIIGIVIVTTIVILPFLKNHRILGEIEILEKKIIIKREKEILDEIFFSDSDFEYLKFNYSGYNGSVVVDSSFLVGFLNRNNGIDNYFELKYKDDIRKFSILIENSEEFKKIKSRLKFISENGIKIYIENKK